MKSKTIAPDVDAYIAEFPPDIQEVLQSIRKAVRASAPEAEEIIKYGIPTYVLHGNLVHFGGFSKHIALYPAPKKDETLREKIEPFLSGQSTLKFPLGKRIPLALIKQIVKYLVAERNQKLQLTGNATRRARRT